MLSIYFAGVAAVTTCFALLLREFFYRRNYPSAPGPSAAKYTRWWYLWKVWGGKFETWNIEQHALHGKVVRVAPQMYSIDDPDAVKVVYGISSPMAKSSWYRFWGDPRVTNHNLFSAQDRHFHAAMRRKVASYYSMTTIKSYEPFVNNCISILLEQFESYATQNKSLDIQHWMQCYAFDVIGEITFGRRIGFLESGGQDIDSIMQKLENNILFSALAGIEPLMLPFLFAKFGNPRAGLFAFVERLLKVGQNHDANDSTHDQMEKSQGAEDFQTKLKRDREKMPEDYEKYHMDVITSTNAAAGSDTTSISLTGVLFYTIKNRRVYLKLREEVMAGIEKGLVSDPITFDQAQALPYLQLVLKEALRVHAATGLPMWRVIPEPGATIAGKFFPAGAIVGINTWVAHFNPTVFSPDPTEFRPERWDPQATPKEQLQRMEQYYIPFGAGTRTCIGKNISILEMTKLIPELVRRFDFELLTNELNCNNHWFVKQKDVIVKLRSRK